MELSSAEMDGDSCCFPSATSPFFLLRFLSLQSLFFLSSKLILSDHTPYIFSFSPPLSFPFLPSLLSDLILLGSSQFRLVYTPFCLGFLPFCFPPPTLSSVCVHFGHIAGSGQAVFCSSLQLCSFSRDIHRDCLACTIAQTLKT